jgi:lipopolysaccharide export system permease protein
MMKILHFMVTKTFIPILILALLFFVLILELVDLFSNLWRYLNYEVTIKEILTVAFFYLPKCLSFSLPIALLFAISFTLGNYYSNNELIAVFGSGISLYRFILPLLVFGLIFSVFLFFFEEKIVIDTFKRKNELENTLLHQKQTYSNTNVTVMSANRRIIYHADYYNDGAKTLSGLIIVERDSEGGFLYRIDAEEAEWIDGSWIMPSCRLFQWDDKKNAIVEQFTSNYTQKNLNEPPKTFRKNVRNIDEMHLQEAEEWIQSLKKAGLPYRGALTEYFRRFSFALTPFVVALISSSIGGRFKKNILLMSLLLSLVISVVYYVTQMILVLFAKLGLIPPFAGAWGTFILFLVVSFWLFKIART